MSLVNYWLLNGILKLAVQYPSLEGGFGGMLPQEIFENSTFPDVFSMILTDKIHQILVQNQHVLKC